MSTILTPETGQQEAANDRFFFYEAKGTEARDAYAFADEFYQRQRGLLPEASGLVLQAGIDANGALVDIHDENKSKNATLCFDGRLAPGAYVWELTEAGNDGRDVYQLHVSRDSSEASHFSFDVQGRLLAKTSCDPDGEIQERIHELARHDRLRKGVEVLRSNRDRMISDLARFSDEAENKLSPEARKKEQDREQSIIDRLGFVSMRPMELKPGITPVLSEF